MKPKKVAKLIPKKVAKPIPKKVAKPIPKKVAKPISNVINLKSNENDFKLENKAIYFAKLDSCYFCNEMKIEWEKAKKNNINIKIYEIDGKYLNRYPDIKPYVPAFPTILRYNNGFRVFNKERLAENFSSFMKNG